MINVAARVFRFSLLELRIINSVKILILLLAVDLLGVNIDIFTWNMHRSAFSSFFFFYLIYNKIILFLVYLQLTIDALILIVRYRIEIQRFFWMLMTKCFIWILIDFNKTSFFKHFHAVLLDCIFKIFFLYNGHWLQWFFSCLRFCFSIFSFKLLQIILILMSLI